MVNHIHHDVAAGDEIAVGSGVTELIN